MSDGRDLERVTAAIQVALADGNGTRVSVANKVQQASGKLREVDVLVEGTLSGHIPFKIAIECKDYSDKVGVELVDALNGKQLPVQRKVLVSSGGFTAGARAAADQYGILLLRYEPLDMAAHSSITKDALRPTVVQHIEAVSVDHDAEEAIEPRDLASSDLANEKGTWSAPLMRELHRAVSAQPPKAPPALDPSLRYALASGTLNTKEPLFLHLADGRRRRVNKISVSVSHSETIPVMSPGIGRFLDDASGKPIADAHAYIYHRPGGAFLKATVRPSGKTEFVIVSHSESGWQRETWDLKLTFAWRLGDRAPQTTTFAPVWMRPE